MCKNECLFTDVINVRVFFVKTFRSSFYFITNQYVDHVDAVGEVVVQVQHGIDAVARIGESLTMYPLAEGIVDLHDHLVHIKEHELFQLTDAFENLPPERQLAFEGHVMKHQEALAEMAQVQAAMQEGAPE